jgi:cytochrome P450
MNAPATQGTLMGKGLSTLWAPFSPANRLNPYPMYQALRELEPVHQLKTGDWVVSRYADVCTVLMDKRFDVIDMPSYFRYKTLDVNDTAVDLYATYQASYHWLLYLRRPMHGRTREMVMKIWATLHFAECSSDGFGGTGQRNGAKNRHRPHRRFCQTAAGPGDFAI